MTASERNGRFYFINKTETSSLLSRCLPDEQAAIQRYVQTGRKRHRPSKKKPHTQGSRTTEVIYQDDQLRHDSQQSQPYHENPASVCIRAKEAYPSSKSPIYETWAAGAESPLPLNPLRGVLGGPDPFNAASVRLDGTVLGLLHYYVYYYHPTLWPNEMVVLKYGLYTFHGAMQAILRMAVENKLTMYCLLSAAACRMQHIDKLPCEPVMSHESFYMYKATGLMASGIRRGLVEADSRQLLICIMFLMSAEAYRDNLSAARTHMRAACRLLEPIGGLAGVQDESLQNRLAMGDLFLACVRMEPCLFECFYDPGPPTSLELQAAELLPHPARLSKMASLLPVDETAVPSELGVLIDQLAESYSVKCRINPAAMAANRVLQITHWVTTRNMAIRNRLLGLSLSTDPARALCTAIIMWSLLAMNVTGRTKTVKIMASSLLSIIERTHAVEWAGCLDVRLWILIVGFQCATEGSHTAGRFASQFRSQGDWLFPSPNPQAAATPALERQLSARLEEFQMQFFFDDEVQRSRTRALAQHALQIVL